MGIKVKQVSRQGSVKVTSSVVPIPTVSQPHQKWSSSNTVKSAQMPGPTTNFTVSNPADALMENIILLAKCSKSSSSSSGEEEVARKDLATLPTPVKVKKSYASAAATVSPINFKKTTSSSSETTTAPTYNLAVSIMSSVEGTKSQSLASSADGFVVVGGRLIDGENLEDADWVIINREA